MWLTVWEYHYSISIRAVFFVLFFIKKDFTCNDLRSRKALFSIVWMVLLWSIKSSKFSSPVKSPSLKTVMLLYLKKENQLNYPNDGSSEVIVRFNIQANPSIVSLWFRAEKRGSSPHVNAFHRRLDVLRDGGEVSEGAVHFSRDVAGAGPGTAAGHRQQESREQQGEERLAAAGSRHVYTGWGLTLSPLYPHEWIPCGCGGEKNVLF